MVAAAAAEVLADPSLYDAWLGRLDRLLKKAAKAKELASLTRAAGKLTKRIPALYRSMDTTLLEEHIAGAMFAADANARAARIRALPDAGLGLADGDEYLATPQTFDASRRWLEQKVNVPTQLSSAEISAQWEARVRNQAFFSARVASANILQSLRSEVEAIASGQRGYGEAKKRLDEFLAREGYGIPVPGTAEDRAMQDLASTARLELVLRQNVAMAHAIGERTVSEDPAVLERYPNYRYVANTARHARYDGLILPKSDPFWKSHYPPWDFGCKCMVLDEDAQPNAKSNGFMNAADGGRIEYQGHVSEVLDPESGFVFESDLAQAFSTFDVSIVEDPELRELLDAELSNRR